MPALTTIEDLEALYGTPGPSSTLKERDRLIPEYAALIAASPPFRGAVEFVRINPIPALFWTAGLNCLGSPPLLVVGMLVSNNKRVMG